MPIKEFPSGQFPTISGQSGKYLTTNGSALSWGTITSGGMTLLTSGNLSGASTSISGIDQTYIDLRLIIRNHETQTAQTQFTVRANNNSSSIYYSQNASSTNSSGTTSWGFVSASPSTSPTSTASIDLLNYTAAVRKVGRYVAWSYTGSLYYAQIGILGFDSTTAISSLQILAGGGETFDGGTYELWGIK